MTKSLLSLFNLDQNHTHSRIVINFKTISIFVKKLISLINTPILREIGNFFKNF